LQIGFFGQGEGPHLDIAHHLIASAKEVMPDVDIYQLTDDKTPILEGARAVRLGGDMPMGVRRMELCASLPGEWVFCDTDIVFKKDVRGVFRKPFDIALASREGTIWAGSEYAKVMPFNTGVIFSKNPKFFQMLLPNLKAMTPAMQEWGGEQFMVNELVRHQDSPFSVEILPSSYNFTPATREEDVSHASILHYKGPRKAWITTHP
jgi:hypothetical protein